MSTPKKRVIKTGISILITALFIAYIYVNRDSIFGALSDIKIEYLPLVFIGQLGIQLSNAALLRDTLLPLNKRLGRVESIKLTMVASFVNFFTPVVGGAGTRAVYLKHRHGLSYSSFAGVLYANYLIIFLVSFLLGLVGLLGINHAIEENTGQILVLFFGAGMLASLIFMMVGHKFTERLKKANVKNRILDKIIGKILLVDEGWLAIRTNKKAVRSMFLWSTTTMLSVVLVYWASMKSLSIHTSPGVALIFSALALLGLLINLTPGSLGVREALYASISTVTGVNAKQVVAFSLVDPSTQILLLGIGWILFGHSIIDSSKANADMSDKNT